MLSTSDIIELYDNQDYDTIINNLNIRPYFTLSEKPQEILRYAINNSNTQLFMHLFTEDNLYNSIILDIHYQSGLHKQFESILERNYNLCNNIGNIINSVPHIYFSVKLMDVIIQYVSNIDYKIIENLFHDYILHNDIGTIKIVLESSYNINFNFDLINSYYCKINISTYIFLEENGIDIIPYINNIYEKYCYRNDIDGIIFCLNRGANIDYALKTIHKNIQLKTVKFLIENGADLNCLNIDTIKGLSDWTVLEFLVDCGLDISNNLNQLMMHAICNNNVDLITYYIKLGINIHLHNELFLFTAIKLDKSDVVKILLDHGADPNITPEINNDKLRI